MCIQAKIQNICYRKNCQACLHITIDFSRTFPFSSDGKTEMVCHRLMKLLKNSNTTSETADESKEVEKETVNLESEEVVDGHFRENNELSKDDEVYGILIYTFTQAERG